MIARAAVLTYSGMSGSLARTRGWQPAEQATWGPARGTYGPFTAVGRSIAPPQTPAMHTTANPKLRGVEAATTLTRIS